MHTSIPACQTDNSIRFKWGLLNVTWWSFVGRNQEQLDAFGAFAAEGTAQIEVITVAWLMKPRLRFLQVLQLGNGKMKLFVTWCDLMWPEISHSQADFNEDFQERSAGDGTDRSLTLLV
jgi:hypothetical protein